MQATHIFLKGESLSEKKGLRTKFKLQSSSEDI